MSSGVSDRGVDLDDRAGISALYDSWTQIAGSALDIGAGANGVIWAVGNGAASGGNTARRLVGTSWVAATGTGGVSVSVSTTGQPIVVTGGGTIKRLSTSDPSTGTWSNLPGCARDVAVGADGSMWAIGCTAAGGGFNIMKFNGASWDNTDGGAVRIAVGADGIPWVVNNGNVLYRRTSSNPFAGGWGQVPGTWPSPASGTDIALNTTPSSPGNYAWLVGNAGGAGAHPLHAWIEQPGGVGIPSQAGWAHATKAPPSGRVAVGPDLRVWLVDGANRIFRSIR
jgi:hypothetical protein